MKVFAKRFFGFDPLTRPFIAFGLEQSRNALIEASAPGDVIVFVGTMDAPTADEDRGRLLGIAEFGHFPVDTVYLMDLRTIQPFDLKPDGSLKCLKALPIVRAWSFSSKLKLLDVLEEELSVEAIERAVSLNDTDSEVVLAIPRREIPVSRALIIDRLKALNDGALINSGPTTGPIPTTWTGIVSRDADRRAWTYALRFGKHDIWKIGHTTDVAARLAQVNQHLPHEILTEQWILFLQHRWASSEEAYFMEQKLFEALHQFRTQGERVRCPEPILQSVWVKTLGIQVQPGSVTITS